VVTTAKRPLAAGTVIDGLGGYDTYGQAECASVTSAERLLPMGVAEGCRLTRDVPQDAVLSYDDVDIPDGRLIDALRAEQARML
jgi:predicted homoserine dehydrogenase-like protein